MYCADYEFSLFLTIFIISSFDQIWSHNLEFSKQTVIWYRDIYDYGFDGHFFTMLAIQFLDKFGLKIYTYCMPNFSFS